MAALDGTIYLVEINSRKILWSFTSGQSIYSSYQALPNHGSDNHNDSAPDDFFIDCGDDWGLYVHGPGHKKVVRTLMQLLYLVNVYKCLMPLLE